MSNLEQILKYSWNTQKDYPRNKKSKKWIFMSVSKLMPVQLRKKIVNWNEMLATHITTNG